MSRFITLNADPNRVVFGGVVEICSGDSRRVSDAIDSRVTSNL